MTLSQALKETYASIGPTTVQHTLEFNHRSFAAPFYIVRDYAPQDLKLDPLAVLPTTFLPYAFQFTEPIKSSTGEVSISLQIDNVDRTFIELVEGAIDGNETPITAVYRVYMSGIGSNEVQATPIHMTIREISITQYRATGKAVITPLVNRAFPNEVYTNTFQNIFLG